LRAFNSEAALSKYPFSSRPPEVTIQGVVQAASRPGRGSQMKDSSEGIVQPTAKRSRRALLAGATGAVGALAAGAVVKASPANAADNDFIQMGTANSESHRTWIDKIGQDGYAVFQGNSTGSDPGLLGNSPAGNGVSGYGASGTGVYGQSGSTVGSAPDKSGVHGVTDAAGYSGVYGEFLGSGVGAAVHGNNLTGTGQGVIGFGASGVYGLATSGGTGVVASMAFDETGLALDAIGPTQFSLSGLASIAAGAKSKVVTDVSLRSTSLILATVQNNAGVSVAYVVPNVAQSKIAINLNKVVPSGKTAKVAWFVIN
jgi:hypothetical protein